MQNVTLPPTLEDALDNIPQIQQKVSSWQDSNQEPPLSGALTKACGVLGDQRFFMGAQGSISRAKIQLKQLSKTIAAFQNKHKQSTMDLKERRTAFEKMGQQKIEDLKKYRGRFPLLAGSLKLNGVLAIVTPALLVVLSIILWQMHLLFFSILALFLSTITKLLRLWSRSRTESSAGTGWSG